DDRVRIDEQAAQARQRDLVVEAAAIGAKHEADHPRAGAVEADAEAWTDPRAGVPGEDLADHLGAEAAAAIEHAAVKPDRRRAGLRPRQHRPRARLDVAGIETRRAKRPAHDGGRGRGRDDRPANRTARARVLGAAAAAPPAQIGEADQREWPARAR